MINTQQKHSNVQLLLLWNKQLMQHHLSMMYWGHVLLVCMGSHTRANTRRRNQAHAVYTFYLYHIQLHHRHSLTWLSSCTIWETFYNKLSCLSQTKLCLLVSNKKPRTIARLDTFQVTIHTSCAINRHFFHEFSPFLWDTPRRTRWSQIMIGGHGTENKFLWNKK